MSATSFEKSITMIPAFDRRHADPTKNYGIHGVEIRFLLKGPKGAIEFGISTNWHLPHVRQETDRRALCGGFDQIQLRAWFHPTPMGVSYHAYTPQYDGQPVTSTECTVLTDARGGCYSGTIFLDGDPVFERLLREGDAGLWAALEERYRERFELVEVAP